MIKVGDVKVVKVYKGEQEIKAIYKGDQKVFDNTSN